MPLGLLVALVVGGIAGIALMCHLTGRSAPRRFADEAAARAAALSEEPDLCVNRVHLSRDGRAALLETDAGPAILWSMGADAALRTLSAPHLEDTADGLRLSLADPTAPAIRVRLDAPDRARWRALLGASQ